MSRHVSSRPHPSWAPYRGRPSYPRRPVVPHRNRTLILNNNVAPGLPPSSTSSPGPASDHDGEIRSATPSGWVAKRDRHMQLINSAIYDKEAQARTKALEETWKLKARKRAQVEEAKVLRYAQGVGRQFPTSSVTTTTTQAPATTQPSAGYRILINDIPFRIARGGSKLIRLSSANPIGATLKQRASLPLTIDDPKTANNTPKKVSVAGVTFVRSKNGNLHRLGAVTSKRWEFYIDSMWRICSNSQRSAGNGLRSRRTNSARDLPPRVPYLFPLRL